MTVNKAHKTQVRLCTHVGGQRAGTIITVIPSVAARLVAKGIAVTTEPRGTARTAAAPRTEKG